MRTVPPTTVIEPADSTDGVTVKLVEPDTVAFAAEVTAGVTASEVLPETVMLPAAATAGVTVNVELPETVTVAAERTVGVTVKDDVPEPLVVATGTGTVVVAERRINGGYNHERFGGPGGGIGPPETAALAVFVMIDVVVSKYEPTVDDRSTSKPSMSKRSPKAQETPVLVQALSVIPVVDAGAVPEAEICVHTPAGHETATLVADEPAPFQSMPSLNV